MIEHKNINEAINAVMDEVGYVKKSKSGGLNYSFAGESALIAAIRPSMVEHGIFMYVGAVLEIRRENYTSKSGTSMINTVIHAIVCFRHVSGEIINVAAVGEGSDSGDKSANKAMTGLYKYALRQTFCIETGDDPDKYASEERAVETKDHSTELVARYQKLIVRAEKAGVPTVDYALSANMPDEEIKSLGVELLALVEAKEKEGK